MLYFNVNKSVIRRKHLHNVTNYKDTPFSPSNFRLKGISFYQYSLNIVLINCILVFLVNNMQSICVLLIFQMNWVKLQGTNPSSIFSHSPLSQLSYLLSGLESLCQRLLNRVTIISQRLLVNTFKALEKIHQFLWSACSVALETNSTSVWLCFSYYCFFSLIIWEESAALFTHPLWQVYCMFVPLWR